MFVNAPNEKQPLLINHSSTKSSRKIFILLLFFVCLAAVVALIFFLLRPETDIFSVVIGDARIYSLPDGSIHQNAIQWFPGVSEAEWLTVFDSNSMVYVDEISFDFIEPYAYGGYLVVFGDTVILIDDGLGNIDPIFQSETDASLISSMESVGFTADDVDFVIHSHLHRDHTGWNTNGAVSNPYIEFPKARYVIQQSEIDYYNSSATLRDQVNWDVVIQPLVDENLLYCIDGAADLVSSKSTKSSSPVSVTVFPCFGHTVGHQCVKLVSASQTVFFFGDLFHVPAQIQNPQWYTSHDYDVDLANANRQACLDLVAEAGPSYSPS